MESQDILSWKGSTRSLSPTPAPAQDCPMNQHKVEATAKTTIQSVNNEEKYFKSAKYICLYNSQAEECKWNNSSRGKSRGDQIQFFSQNGNYVEYDILHNNVDVRNLWNQMTCIITDWAIICQPLWHPAFSQPSRTAGSAELWASFSVHVTVIFDWGTPALLVVNYFLWKALHQYLTRAFPSWKVRHQFFSRHA